MVEVQTRRLVRPASRPRHRPPAWAGFPRPHRRRRRRREPVGDVVPVRRGRGACPRPDPASSSPCVCRDAGDPVPVRTYSLSGHPDGGRYRISVKRESHGLVSSHLHAHLHRGTRCSRSRRRGATSCSTRAPNPVLLISAGIGLTPLLAMLHRLAASAASARCGGSTPPTTAKACLLRRSATPCSPALPHALARLLQRRHARECRARTAHRGASHEGQLSRLAARRRERLRLRPGAVHGRRAAALAGLGSTRPAFTPSGSAPGRRSTPASSGQTRRAAAPAARPARGRPGGDLRPLGISRRLVDDLATACSSSPRRATCPRSGPAAPASATPASRRCCPATSPTPRPLEAPADEQVLICSARPSADLVLDV